MSNMKSFADIIPSIGEDQEVENFSEDTDEEVEVFEEVVYQYIFIILS